MENYEKKGNSKQLNTNSPVNPDGYNGFDDFDEFDDTEANSGYNFADFGMRMKRIMMIRDISNQELADRLFISRSTISGYRTGRRSPDVHQLAAIARELHVSADYLVGTKTDYNS
jgi:ribosome-binding protein aMBF1 (putative translation factor)